MYKAFIFVLMLVASIEAVSDNHPRGGSKDGLKKFLFRPVQKVDKKKEKTDQLSVILNDIDITEQEPIAAMDKLLDALEGLPISELKKVAPLVVAMYREAVSELAPDGSGKSATLTAAQLEEMEKKLDEIKAKLAK